MINIPIFIDLWQSLPMVRFACFWPLFAVSWSDRVSIVLTLSITLHTKAYGTIVVPPEAVTREMVIFFTWHEKWFLTS